MDFQTYPLNVLYRARDAFRRNWFNTMSRDPIAVYIYNLQYSHPPRLTVYNTTPYPFEEANSYYPHSDLLLSSGRRDNNSNYVHPETPDVYYQRNSKRQLDISSVASLTEKALTAAKRSKLEADEPTTSGSQSDGFFYACDVCDEAGLLSGRNVAEMHLRDSGHVSCSRYARHPSTEEGKESRLELITPRDVFIEEVSGWRAGDTIVYCPTCHLITLDKLLCAYHHETLHENRQPAYSLARVVSIRSMSVAAGRHRCEPCNKTFPHESQLFTHWNKTKPKLACSPFRENRNGHCNSSQRLVNFECLQCGLQRDLTLTAALPVEKVANLAHFMGVSMISHLLTHGRNIRHSDRYETFKMRFRFIDCGDSSRQLLPPLSLSSHFAALLFSLKEANRQQELLKKFKKTRKHQLGVANQAADRLKAVIEHQTKHC